MADIYLDIGVNGGASLTGASGAAIERDITAIVRAIEQNVTTKLEFRADETALNNMVNQIETAFRNANITINTSGLEAQLRAATEAVAGISVGTSTSGSAQAQDIDRVTRSIENLAEGEREAANAARERVNVLREWLVLSQQADRSEADKRRLKAINGTLGSYTKNYRSTDSQYADRYTNVNQSSERSALTRRIILEDAERIFASYGLSNELEYLQNIRDEFGLDAGEIIQEINAESQAISDAIERQGDEVESATDEATQQIEEGTQRLVGAYENRAAALAEVSRRIDELTSRRDSEGNPAYTFIDEDDRRNNDVITQRAVRLRQSSSGNIFTNRYNLDEHEDGSFDIRLVSNESNRQVQNYLNGVVDKLDTIRHKRDQIVDDKNTGQLAAGLTKGLDKAVTEVDMLVQAARRAIETGDYSQFQRDTFLGGRYSNVTDIDSVMSAIDRAMEDAQYSMRGFTTEVNKAYKESNNLVATYSKIDSLRSKVSNSENRYSTGEGSTYNQVVKDFEMIDELKAKIDATGKTLATDNFSAGAKNAEKYTSELRELYDIVIKLEYHIQQLEQDSNNLSDSYIKSQTDNFQKDYEAFIKSPAAYDVDKDLYNNTQLRQILADINKVNQAIKKGESNWESWDDPTKESFSRVRNNINQIIEANSRLSTANQKLITEERRKNNVLTQTHKTYSEALRYYKEHESGIKKNIELNKKWAKVLDDIHSGRYGDDIGGMRTALSELQTETKDAGAETKTLHAQLKKLFHDHFGSVAATTIIGAITDILRNAYTRVLDIDKAMTELRKVTDLTEESYKRFGETAARVAREVGGTIADTINATADFARLGFSVNEATELAKAAMIYKNVGDGIEDISQASESIISTIKGFGLEASDAMGIIDKFNEVGNKYAIDSVGIGEALKRSAAALSAANNTLDESIALVTAANNVIQDPDVVGTAMKTMSMFLRAAKTEAEEAGIETEGMANSVSELREEMEQLTGIDIMIDDATFKSTYQILQDISRVWDKLTDVDQANIAEKLVGKRQANIFFSLVENFGEAEEVLKTSLDAAGSAAEENEKYLASIEGRIQSLLISFEELSTGILDSGLVKSAIEFLTNIVNLLNSVNDFGGGDGVAILASVAGLSTLFSRSGGFGFETLVDEKGLTYLTLFGEKLTVLGDKADRAKAQIEKADLGTAIKDWANHFFLGYKSTTDIKKEMSALEEYSECLHKVAISGGDVNKFAHDSLFSDESTLKIKNADLATRDFANTLTKCAGDSDTLNKEIKDYGAKLEIANKKTSLGTSLVKKFGAAFANIGSAIAGTLILFAINAVIDGIVKLIDHLHTTKEEAEEARQALVTAAQDSANELKAVSDELDNIRQKIDNINEEKIDPTSEETLKQLKAQESSLENQYIWLTRIDEYNKRNAYQATDSKILATDREIPQELRNTSAGENLPGLFGTISSTQLASSIIEAITWYRTELSEFQKGGLNGEELSLFGQYHDSINTLQKELNEIFTEWQGYFSEGTIQYSTDPSSTYQIITKIQERANKENSLSPIGNSQAYQNYVEFLDSWKLDISNMLNEISVSGINSEYSVNLQNEITDSTINPVTGDTEYLHLGEEYTQKLFEYLLSSFIEQNPLGELTSEEFDRWQGEFFDYVMRNTDEASWALLQDKRLNGEEDITKWGDFSSFYDNVIKLLPTQSQIDILEVELQNLQDNYRREVNENGELSSKAQQYSTKIFEVIPEIERAKQLLVENSVKLADDIAKAGADYTSQLSTHIESLASKQGELQAAYDEVSENGSLDLSSQTAQDLLKIYPELIKYSDKYTNTLNISSQTLEAYFSQTKQSVLDAIKFNKKEINDAIAELKLVGDIEENDDHKKLYDSLIAQQELLEAQTSYIQSWSLIETNSKEINNALDVSDKLNKQFSILKKSREMISSFNPLNTTWISEADEILREIQSIYPNNLELNNAITAYKDNATKQNAQAIVDIFNDLYQRDLGNFNVWLDKKTGESTWKDFIENNTSWVNEFKTSYEVDLSNFKTYQEARAGILDQVAQSITNNDAWYGNKLVYELLPESLRREIDKRSNNLRKELEDQFLLYNPDYLPVGDPGDESGDGLSTQKEKYEEALAEQEDLYNRGLISYEEYLKERSRLLDEYIPAGVSAESDAYRKEELTRTEWETLFEERMSKWEEKTNYNKKNLDSILKRNKEAGRLAKQMFYGADSEYNSPALYKKQIEEIAKSDVDTLKEMLDRGIIEYTDYMEAVVAIREQYTDENGGFILPISFVAEAQDPEKEFENKIEEWKKNNDYDENNADSRNNYNNFYRQVAKEIYGNETLISYNPAKLEELLSEADNYDNETQELKESQTLDFLNQTRDLVLERYEEEEAELDAINEKEQRRLDIVKARIDLENAKKNRNQLVFANGGYYYDYDQEAIENAESNYQSKLEEERKASREEEKDNAIRAWDMIIEAVENSGESKTSQLHSDVVQDALSSQVRDGQISQEDLESLRTVLDNDSQILQQIKDGSLSLSIDDIGKIVRDIQAETASLGIISTEEQSKVDAAVYNNSTVHNDNSVSIGTIVNQVTVPEGTTEQQVEVMINGFASELMETLKSLSTTFK